MSKLYGTWHSKAAERERKKKKRVGGREEERKKEGREGERERKEKQVGARPSLTAYQLCDPGQVTNLAVS